jgi:hypothetical protein
VIALLLACVVPISAAVAALPFTFVNGTVADANQVNSNLNSLDTRVTGLTASAFTTVSSQTLNMTDLPSASWQPFAVVCINQLTVNVTTCSTGNGCWAVPNACTIAAMRKCAGPDGLGYRFGFFVGEAPGDGTESIICVK